MDHFFIGSLISDREDLFFLLKEEYFILKTLFTTEKHNWATSM